MLPRIDPEFQALIPPLSVAERAQLEQNIISHGKCRDAIILWDGVIIDGHNRFDICLKNGIQFEITEMTFQSREEAMVWILEHQLGKRNLPDAAKIELAMSKAELLKEEARRKQSRAGGDKKSDKQRAESLLSKTSTLKEDGIHVQKALASEAGVSEGTLFNYIQVKQNAPPELLSRVQSGEIKIGTAHSMLAKEILKKLRNADKEYEFIFKNATATPDISGLIAELSQQLQTLINKMEEIQCKQS